MSKGDGAEEAQHCVSGQEGKSHFNCCLSWVPLVQVIPYGLLFFINRLMLLLPTAAFLTWEVSIY